VRRETKQRREEEEEEEEEEGGGGGEKRRRRGEEGRTSKRQLAGVLQTVYAVLQQLTARNFSTSV